MGKKPVFWSVLSAIIMLLLPWLAVTYAESDAGMAAVLLLLFGIDPLYCVIVGTYAGKNLRHLWWQPLLASVLFLAGTWLFFEMGEGAFLRYACIYFLLSMVVMFASWNLEQRRKKYG